MRAIITSLLLAYSSIAFCQNLNKPVSYHPIKTIAADLNNDGKPDVIELSSSLNHKNYFNKITIAIAGLKKQSFRAKDGWAIVDKWFLDSNKNEISSKLLFVKKTDKHTVILLFGSVDESGYRSEFSIINIENDVSKMVLDFTGIGIERPIALTDLENNGRLCFVYTSMHELYASSKKGKQPDIGTYTPYFVYPVDSNYHLDKQLSKKYMQEHYVFAGFKYSEDIKVLYPLNGGKPKLWKGRP